MKSLRIAWQLLWANRWLWLLLVLWPWGMAALLLFGSTPASPDDLESALQQQAIYGLALVAFTGGALLGTEQRSRRIVMVLARAVSRRQYLAALWWAAYLPLLVYSADLLLTGWMMHAPRALLSQTTAAMLMLGAVTASLAVLASLVLPGVIAGGASLGVIGLLLVQGGPIALGRLLQVLLNGSTLEGNAAAVFTAAILESTLTAACLFEIAVRMFVRRDLRLKSE